MNKNFNNLFEHPQIKAITSQLTDEITKVETTRKGNFGTDRAQYHCDAWPSPVTVFKDELSGSGAWRLRANWALPDGLDDMAFSNWRELERAVKLHLDRSRLGTEFEDAKAKPEQKRKQVAAKPLTSEFCNTIAGVQMLERWYGSGEGSRVEALFTSKNLPSPISAIKRNEDFFYSVKSDAELPECLQGQYRSLKFLHDAIANAVANSKFPV